MDVHSARGIHPRGITTTRVERTRQRKTQGLCIVCGEPAKPDRTRCPYHLAQDYKDRVAYRARHKGKRCLVCARALLSEDMEKGLVKCQNCREHTFELRW